MENCKSKLYYRRTQTLACFWITSRYFLSLMLQRNTLVYIRRSETYISIEHGRFTKPSLLFLVKNWSPPSLKFYCASQKNASIPCYRGMRVHGCAVAIEESNEIWFHQQSKNCLLQALSNLKGLPVCFKENEKSPALAEQQKTLQKRGQFIGSQYLIVNCCGGPSFWS